MGGFCWAGWAVVLKNPTAAEPGSCSEHEPLSHPDSAIGNHAAKHSSSSVEENRKTVPRIELNAAGARKPACSQWPVPFWPSPEWQEPKSTL